MATTTETLFKGPDTVEHGEVVIIHNHIIEITDGLRFEYFLFKEETEPFYIGDRKIYPSEATIEDYLIYLFEDLFLVQEDLTIDIQFEEVRETNVLFEVTQ